MNVEYAGPGLVMEYFIKHTKDRDITPQTTILDVGAGTGLVAQQV